MSDQQDALVDRLDRLIALTTLANAREIAAAAEDLRADPVTSAILDGCTEWTPSGSLQDDVAKRHSVSTRTVRNKIATLVSRGLIASRGAGRATEYRAAGIV